MTLPASKNYFNKVSELLEQLSAGKNRRKKLFVTAHERSKNTYWSRIGVIFIIGLMFKLKFNFLFIGCDFHLA